MFDDRTAFERRTRSQASRCYPNSRYGKQSAREIVAARIDSRYTFPHDTCPDEEE
jgi:hypothetical protein